jgi:hypothetical protein
MNESCANIDSGSFRDPSGMVFEFEHDIYRAIAPSYFSNFSLLESSGLYKSLTEKKLLIPYSEINSVPPVIAEKYPGFKIIKPEKIPFITYSYEWCFSQLKNAALLTLSIQKEAISHGMSLKDATAFNVQFIGIQPVLIDTLSFEVYKEGMPWAAYGQFCRHFLAPLALMAYRSISLSKLSQLFLDGIPLDLANTLLPKRALLNAAVLSHINIHSKFISPDTASELSPSKKTPSLSKNKLLALIEHLEDGVQNFKLKKIKSTWIDYDKILNYSTSAQGTKHNVVSGWIKKIQPKTVWDIGCNTGEYSLLASEHAKSVVAMDFDALCIETLYNNILKEKTKNILPLVIDITNPTPAIGWANKERKDLPGRGSADMLLALAVVHHLRIGNNTPWEKIAELFSQWGNWAIVEFIPKEDSQIQKMLAQRIDIFEDINSDAFQKAFEKYFDIMETAAISDSTRTLYLLKKKQL